MEKARKLEKEWHTGVWDEELECWISKTKCNVDKFSEAIKNHFKHGGLYRNTVLANICGVTEASIRNWTNPKSRHYKKDFHQLVTFYRTAAAKFTDDLHVSAAAGIIQTNDRILNRRAEDILQLYAPEHKTKKLDRLKNSTDAVERANIVIDALADQKITITDAQFLMQMIRDTITIEQEEKIRPMLEEIKEKMAERDNVCSS